MKTHDILENFKIYVKTICAKIPPSIVGLKVFGSYAKGNPKITSDLDVALITTEEFSRMDRIEIREILEGFYDNIEINLFCTTEEKISSTQSKFDANYWIREEGELIWIR